MKEQICKDSEMQQVKCADEQKETCFFCDQQLCIFEDMLE